MRLTTKPVFFGTPILLALGTFALLWMLMGGTSGGGLNDTVKYEGFVEWKVFSADGTLKQSFSGHNAINPNPALDDTTNRLIGGMTTDIELTTGVAGHGLAAFARIYASEQERTADSTYDATDTAEKVGDVVEVGFVSLLRGRSRERFREIVDVDEAQRLRAPSQDPEARSRPAEERRQARAVRPKDRGRPQQGAGEGCGLQDPFGR